MENYVEKKYFQKGLVYLICKTNKLEPTKQKCLTYTSLRKIIEICGYQFIHKYKYFLDEFSSYYFSTVYTVNVQVEATTGLLLDK